jgi:hypothetical protein
MNSQGLLIHCFNLFVALGLLLIVCSVRCSTWGP